MKEEQGPLGQAFSGYAKKFDDINKTIEGPQAEIKKKETQPQTGQGEDDDNTLKDA